MKSIQTGEIHVWPKSSKGCRSLEYYRIRKSATGHGREAQELGHAPNVLQEKCGVVSLAKGEKLTKSWDKPRTCLRRTAELSHWPSARNPPKVGTCSEDTAYGSRDKLQTPRETSNLVHWTASHQQQNDSTLVGRIKHFGTRSGMGLAAWSIWESMGSCDGPSVFRTREFQSSMRSAITCLLAAVYPHIFQHEVHA